MMYIFNVIAPVTKLNDGNQPINSNKNVLLANSHFLCNVGIESSSQVSYKWLRKVADMAFPS